MSSTEQQGFLVIARVAAPHGLRGELRADILTDFPERFERLRSVYAGNSPETVSQYAVDGARIHKRQVLLKLRGVDTAEQVDAMRRQLLFVPEDEAVPLIEGQYYWHQILGLRVETVDGQALGEIADILRTGSNDVYVVRAGSKEILIPAIEDVVKEVDPPSGRMVVQLMPGIAD